MKILIINGSPSGENSVTLQTMLFLEKKYPMHTYDILHVGQRIRRMEEDFSEAGQKLSDADLLVFCYPVYTFLVPSQLHRFLEIIKEKKIDLSGKFATQISTSKHFYDITAHEFIRENCLDLKLHYIRGLSADMEDLLKRKGRKEAVSFFHHVLWSIRYASGKCGKPKNVNRRVVIVTDLTEKQEKLRKMIERFREVFPYETEVVNLRDFTFQGGCLGCFHCASTGECIYRDGFDRFLREKIQTAEATVYAFTIKDHSMGYRFKLYDDRQFCNGHRTVTMGKPVGYLVDGKLQKEPNLRTLIEARAQVGRNYLAGIATGGSGAKEEIRLLSAELHYAIARHYEQPADFYGVGGMKIFRDLIYKMRGMMKEDHRFYKTHGFYDFPQKEMGTIAGMYLVGAMMNSRYAKSHGSLMTTGMLMPYKKIVEDASADGKRSGTEKDQSSTAVES